MPSIDMPLERLREYQPNLRRPDDLDAFWQSTLARSASQPINAELVPYPLRLRGLKVYAVRFDGFAAEGDAPARLAGWFVCPDTSDRVPALMFYHGYSGRGQRPMDMALYASQGIACFSMDVRGQNGDSVDASNPAGGHATGWMTQGIRSPLTYYYRHVYADAVRALELLANRPEVDASRIGLTGGSQGGALSLAAAALSDRATLCVPDVPFLCDFPRAVQICGTAPFNEISRFLKVHPALAETVFHTLSYFDCVNLAPRIRARTVMAISLWDDICPPSGAFAAYHAISAEKSVEIYPYHGHEIPHEFHEVRLLAIQETLRH